MPRQSLPLPAASTLAAALAIAMLALGPDPAQANATADTAETLDRIEVVGRSLSGTYYADEAAGAKTALPLRELPQSVRVLSRQAIDDLGALRLSDTVDYVGGVSRQNNFGGLWDNLALRGLPGNENTGSALLQNGFSANRGFNAPRDTADVERFEFLKGPASALYGSSEPGGTINVVSKRPLWQPASSLELYGGSHSFRRAAFDSTAPVGESLPGASTPPSKTATASATWSTSSVACWRRPSPGSSGSIPK
jgi:iron complex outermembrane recepter protein